MDIDSYIRHDTSTTTTKNSDVMGNGKVADNDVRRDNPNDDVRMDNPNGCSEYRQSMRYGGDCKHRWEISIRPTRQGR